MSKHKFLIIKYNLIYNYPKNILYLLLPSYPDHLLPSLKFQKPNPFE